MNESHFRELLRGTRTHDRRTARRIRSGPFLSMERQSWDAWKARDAEFFQAFLSQDPIEIFPQGRGGKKAVIASVASPACVVKSFAVGDFRVTLLGRDAAVVTYHTRQDTACTGRPVPSPVWFSSTYAKRADRWVNVRLSAVSSGEVCYCRCTMKLSMSAASRSDDGRCRYIMWPPG